MAILTLFASLVTLWVTGIWWIVPLGVLAAAIIAAQSVLSESQDKPGALDDDAFLLAGLHSEHREKFLAVLEQKRKILDELKESEEGAFLNAKEISARVEELVGSYYDLLQKLEKVRPFIDHAAMASLDNSIEALKVQIQGCSDDLTGENLSLALKSKADHRHTLTELSNYRSRVESQLVNLAATLNSLYVRIVQIRVSPDSSLDPTSEIKERIKDMMVDVDISEKLTKEYQRIFTETAL